MAHTPSKSPPGRLRTRMAMLLHSIRTWLAATLVAVSLFTAAAIGLYVVPAADHQFRSLAQDAALGLTARAAHDAGTAHTQAELQEALARASRDGQLSLWLLDANGREIATSSLPSVRLRSLPDVSRAIAVALVRAPFRPDRRSDRVARRRPPGAHALGWPSRARRLRATHGARGAHERGLATQARARRPDCRRARRHRQPRCCESRHPPRAPARDRRRHDRGR